MKSYKCVRVQKNFQGKAKGNQDMIQAYEQLLNAYAQEGWQLVNIDQIRTHIPAGCIAGLFGASGSVREESFYIFEKEG